MGQKKSQKKQLLCLAALSVLWIAVMIYNFFYREDTSVEKVLMCTKCDSIFIMKIEPANLTSYKCPKCSGALGLAYKCSKCDYNFPVIPKQNPFDPVKEKKQYIKFFIEEKKCPNCGSIETFPFPRSAVNK